MSRVPDSPEAQTGGSHAYARRGRPTPRTAATILAISDGYRATNVVFMRDGELDPQERHALALLARAAAHAAYADWDRKARNNWEDYGHVTPGLLRERRELARVYGDEPETA